MPPPTKRDITNEIDEYDASVDPELCLPPANTVEVSWTTWDADTAVPTSSLSSETLLTSEPSSSLWTSTLSSMTIMPSSAGTTLTTTRTSASTSASLTTLTFRITVETTSASTTVEVATTTVSATETYPSDWPGPGQWALMIYNTSHCTVDHNKLSMTGETFRYMGWNQECHDVNYTNLDPSFTNSMSWRVYNGNCTVYDTNGCWWQSMGHNATYYAGESCLNSDDGLDNVGKWAAIKCIAQDFVPEN